MRTISWLISVFVCGVLYAAPPSKTAPPSPKPATVDIPVTLRVAVDPDVNGRLELLEKRVGAIEGKVDLTNKKLDKVLSAMEPITKWVQSQSVQEKTQKTKRKESYVWVASEYGEYAFQRGSTGELEAYFKGEWRQCYLPHGKKILCVMWGNSYFAVGNCPQPYEALEK